MTQDEIEEIYDRAEMHYEMLKDTCHDQYEEIQQLKSKINNVNKYIDDLLEEGIEKNILESIKFMLGDEE